MSNLNHSNSRGLSRRQLLKHTACGAAGMAGLNAFFNLGQPVKILRQLGDIARLGAGVERRDEGSQLG